MKDNNFINEWNGGKSNDSKYLKVYYKKTFQFKIKKKKDYNQRNGVYIYTNIKHEKELNPRIYQR